MDVTLTEHEAALLISALEAEHDRLREIGTNQPLASHDPNTTRYEWFDKASLALRRASAINKLLRDERNHHAA